VFTVVKMLLVFALLGGTLWFLRRHDRSSLISARKGERPVAVLAQAKVGKTASVALVRIAGEAYAVGVTEQNVSLLVAEPVSLPEIDAESEPEDSSGGRNASPTTARPLPPTVTDALRSAFGRRQRVEYLDVALPVQTGRAPGTNGSGSSPAARRPEPMTRR
jgi:flagellar biogenesis protein FliO